ncbi:MAG: diacylglycerol kinase [Parasphingorhabdus sp.]|uniref:diacylglycerol kinase n=1 Tax=Parasphingorhabdus sp. TaxID=2709688 RepID=UPI0032994874
MYVNGAVTREFNSSIKAAKDVAAGAVLFAAVAAALIGASVFLPYVITMNEAAQSVGASLICSGAH